MNIKSIITVLATIFFLLFVLGNFVSATSFTRTWTCSGGLDCDLYSKECHDYVVDAYFNTQTYSFSAPLNGPYNCIVRLHTSDFGFYGGMIQTNEKTTVSINGKTIMTSKDSYCNSGYECHSCSTEISQGSAIVNLSSFNTMLLQNYESHSYDYISLICTFIGTCTPGQTEIVTCGLTNLGECSYGSKTRTCKSNYEWSDWSSCTAIYPQAEICDGKDNNCNGLIDEQGVCLICNPGTEEFQICGQTDEGECSYGFEKRTCDANGSWSNWEGCTAVFPTAEVCDGKDNDCDGSVDEDNVCGSSCHPGDIETQTCGQTDEGECSYGIEKRTCETNGSWSNWEGCTAVFPTAEICDGKDNDCDGSVDEGCVFECNDNLDNDGDNVIDEDDPGCYTNGVYNPFDDDESDATTECQDGIDNDGDGDVDMEDKDCFSPVDNNELDHKCNKFNVKNIVYDENIYPGGFLELSISIASCYKDFKTIISSDELGLFRVFNGLRIVPIKISEDIEPGEYEFKVTIYSNQHIDSVFRTLKVLKPKKSKITEEKAMFTENPDIVNRLINHKKVRYSPNEINSKQQSQIKNEEGFQSVSIFPIILVILLGIISFIALLIVITKITKRRRPW